MPGHMDLGEFQRRGYLMEVNRRFFHPLGLELALRHDPDGSYHLDHIIDVRDADDQEGIIFGDWDQPMIDNAERIDHELAVGFSWERVAGLGFVVEPIPPEPCKHEWEKP